MCGMDRGRSKGSGSPESGHQDRLRLPLGWIVPGDPGRGCGRVHRAAGILARLPTDLGRVVNVMDVVYLGANTSATYVRHVQHVSGSESCVRRQAVSPKTVKLCRFKGSKGSTMLADTEVQLL